MIKITQGSAITNISHKGFELIHRNISNKYLWKEFSSISFDKSRRKLICKKGLFQKVVVTDYFQGWYCLIRKIPRQFSDFDFNYVDQFFSSLRPCNVCGNISVHKGSCCNCGAEAWNRLLAEEYDSEIEYLREEQFDFFATHDATEFFDGFYRHNPCFSFNSNWKPLISEPELLQYCEDHYWE